MAFILPAGGSRRFVHVETQVVEHLDPGYELGEGSLVRQRVHPLDELLPSLRVDLTE